MISLRRLLLYIVLLGPLAVLSDTVTGISNGMMLDTRTGELSIDLADPIAGELDIRMSSVWDSGPSASLCIDGVKTKTIGSGNEVSLSLDTSDYKDWYFCELVVGSIVYTRMLRMNYAGKPVIPFEEASAEATSGGIMLDTRKGDLTIDLANQVEGDRVIRLSTLWDSASSGSLCVNGVRRTVLGENDEADVGLTVADCLNRCFCEWTSGGKVYTRTIKPVSGSTVDNPGKVVTSSAGIRLDTMQGTRDIADYWGYLAYSTEWYVDAASLRIQECSEVIAEGTKGTVEFSRTMCGYNFALFATDESGRQSIRERAQFAGGEGDCMGVITKSAVEPTSSTAGSEAEITCIHCGTILQPAAVIPALGYVRNVTARQLWPHKIIEICYDLSDDIADVLGADAEDRVPLVITGKYLATPLTATTILGDATCVPGHHVVIWDMENDNIAVNKFSTAFTVAYSDVSRESGGVIINTSTSVTNGMSVVGALELDYSPFANGEVTVEIDGVATLSSTNSGTFTWQPRTTGEHSIKHISGDYEWTRIVNVTETVFNDGSVPAETQPDENISIGSTSRAFESAGGSGTVTTKGSGTWEATVSDDWITLPAYSSSNAGRPLAYRVAANSGVESRTGYIYINGHVFTVTQSGVGADLDAYEVDFETDGGNGSFTVLADAQLDWKIKPNVDWISVTTDDDGEMLTDGTGEAMVYFTVAPWNEVSTRVGTITVAGRTFTVNQTGRRIKVYVPDAQERVPPMVELDYQSHVVDVSVNALTTTEWEINPGASWISVVDGGKGYGGDNIVIGVNENPSYATRTANVRIGTDLLVVQQNGRPAEELEFNISPVSAQASVDGANAIIAVSATPDLPWTAVSSANWITVMPGFNTGAGNGNVVYTVSPNPTMSHRTGTITVTPNLGGSLPLAVVGDVSAVSSATIDSQEGIAPRTHTVTQPAAEAMISETQHVFGPAGSSFDVEVTVADVVEWGVCNEVDWVSVVRSASPAGPATVTIAVSENNSVEPRSTTLTIAGRVFAVKQQGRSVEVEYGSIVFGVTSDFSTIDIHPNGNIQWKAVPSDTWIIVWGEDGDCEYDEDYNLIGTGDATIGYMVEDYVGDGTPRTGTITIGDKVIYITQRAYELSINPSATWVDGNAGSGSVSVPASAGDVWNAIATEPWITVANTTGTGSGTVQYTFTENDTGEVRTGRIIISGEEYTITQAARQMVAINAMANGNGGVVSGGGTYELGTDVTLTAVANDGYVFSGWTLPGGTSTVNPLVVTADVDKEIVATFTRIPYYLVNGESVREGTVKSFTAPEAVVDGSGTTKLVCLGTSMYPEKGTSFNIAVTGDISFEWDLWQTNYLVTVEQTAGGMVALGGSQSSATWIASGTEITLTATPAAGNSFFRWNIAQNPDNPVNPVQNNSASLRLCVESPVTVSAEFGVFNDSLADSLDAAELVFKTGGDAQWAASIDSTAQSSYTSARSGAIGPESETWMETTLTGSGTLSFRWKVDCEQDDGGGATWDRLSVFTNNVEAARIDGNSGWRTVTLPVSGEKTTVRWSFYRDDYDDPAQAHENAAWVDGVNWVTKQ